MIKTLIAIILASSFAQAWDCPKTYEKFREDVLALHEKAIKLAEAEDSKKLLYETGESGELVTLLAVSRVNKDETIAGFAMQCWSYYYDFLQSLKISESTRNEKRNRNEILGRWQDCFVQFYQDKSIGKDIVTCHRNLTK